jgi:hypothetical protein
MPSKSKKATRKVSLCFTEDIRGGVAFPTEYVEGELDKDIDRIMEGIAVEKSKSWCG